MLGEDGERGADENGHEGTYRVIPDFEILDFDPCLLCDTAQ